MKRYFLLGVVLCFLKPHLGQTEVLWQDFSVTYLKGNHYRVEHPKKQVLTFEHAAATSWGDSFFFLDHLRAADGGRENYGEWAPRLSGQKLLNSTFNWGLIKDVLLSSQVEFSSLQTNFLYGLGVDLALPGFQYFQVNGFRRVNDGQPNTWQLTTTWALPFELAHQTFLYDGFLDWASGRESQHAHFNLTSQFKWALHPLLHWKTPLYLGVEYVYWRHKYGIQDTPEFRTHESNLNLLIKAHF